MSNLPIDPEPKTADSTDDPFAGLYKMSPTAGVATQGYVAVNPTAVIALLLGLASALAVMFGSLLLIIPIVAVIVGVVAIVQVKNSGGTETGKGLALIGILLAVLCAGARGGKELLNQRMINQERGQILALIDQLGKDLAAADYDSAWSRFSDRYKQTVRKESFVFFWEDSKAKPAFGQVVGMHSNGIVEVKIDPETGSRTAEGLIIVDLKLSAKPARVQATFRKFGDQWLFDSIGIQFNGVAAAPAQ